MPLVQHLEDSAEVAGYLWDRWISPIVRRQASAGLPGSEDDGRVLLRFLAGVHDVGKATPAFACQMPALLDRMRDNGLSLAHVPPRSDSRVVPHATAGQVALRRWLHEQYAASPIAADTLACVVGGHHGLPAGKSGILVAMERPDLMGGAPWSAVQDELLTGMADRTGATGRLAAWMKSPPQPAAQSILTALVIVADWLASDENRFPFGNFGYETDPAQRA